MDLISSRLHMNNDSEYNSRTSFKIFSIIISILTWFITCQAQTGTNYFTFPNTKLHFVSGSTMGLYMAVVIPVDLPPTNTYLGFFIEGIYSLPTNETSFEYPPLVERGIDRKFIYRIFENNIETRGFPGKPCLLRAICEASMYSIHEASGILGNIFHIILTPSSSKNHELSSAYEKAELMGRAHECLPYTKNCDISIVNMISTFIDDWEQ